MARAYIAEEIGFQLLEDGMSMPESIVFNISMDLS